MPVKAKNNVELQRKAGADWTNPDIVPGIFTSGGGGVSNERIDVTAFDTPGNSRAFIGGLSEPQALTYEMNYEPGDEVQRDIRAQNLDGSAHEYRILIGDEDGTAPETYTFSALVTRYGNPTGPVEGKLSVAFELTPTAAGVWADVP
jgi:hypothetical protein